MGSANTLGLLDAELDDGTEHHTSLTHRTVVQSGRHFGLIVGTISNYPSSPTRLATDKAATSRSADTYGRTTSDAVTQQLQPMPKVLEFPWLSSISRFQMVANPMELREKPKDDNSSISSSSSSSDLSDSDDETRQPLPDGAEIKRVFVQNGPAGCCHIAIPAPADTPQNRLFSYQDGCWTARCGASLRAAAKSISWD